MTFPIFRWQAVGLALFVALVPFQQLAVAQQEPCRWNGKSYPVGVTVEFECPSGYAHVSSVTQWNCTASSTWWPEDEPGCVKIDAGSISQSSPSFMSDYPKRCPSGWGSWGDCTTPCDENSVQLRYRGSIQDFSLLDGLYIYAQCSIDIDTRDCYPQCKAPKNPEQPSTTRPTSEAAATTAGDETTGAATTTNTASATEEVETPSVDNNAPTESADSEATQAAATTKDEANAATSAGLSTTKQQEDMGPNITPDSNPNVPPGPNGGCAYDSNIDENAVLCEFQGKLFLPGARLQFHCEEGFKRKGPGSRKCKPTGKWSRRSPACKKNDSDSEVCPGTGWWGECDKDCLDQPGVGFKQRSIYSQVLQDRCAPLNGKFQVRCEARIEQEICRGNRFCAPQPCPGIIAKPNSRLQIVRQVGPGRLFHNGSVVKIVCDQNYEADGFQRLACVDGVWSDPVPNCVLLESHLCSHPDMAGGQCLPQQPTHAVGSFVTCTCPADGYGNPGSAVRFCREDKSWSGIPTSCVYGHTACPNPGIPDNGRRSGQSFQPGEFVVFACNPGFHLQGNSIVHCLENGSWEHTIPQCIYNYEPVDRLINRLGSREGCRAGQSCPCLPPDVCTSCPARNDQTYRRGPFNIGVENAMRPCCGYCSSCCLELVFVLDESSSISPSSFHASVAFAREVVEAQLSSVQDQSCLRVGGVSFSHNHLRLSNLTLAKDVLADRNSWLSPRNINPRGGSTGTRCGLTGAQSLLDEQAREGCRKIVFLMTDGDNNWCGNPIAHDGVVPQLKCNCTELFAVGMGANLNIQTLRSIVSDPYDGHLFVLQQFGDLHSLGFAFLERRIHL